MKLLFFHTDPALLARLLDRPTAAQNLVISCTEPGELIPLVAATEPHLIVLAGDGDKGALEEIGSSLRGLGFHARILVLPRDRWDDMHLDAVWSTLRSFPREPLLAEFNSQHYEVLTEKESRPAEDLKSAESVAAQENRLLALLETGTLRHARAQAYLRAAIATQRHYGGEWTAAALAGDPKAYIWRGQLFRYVSVLAHSVPGVDTECLPLPHPPAERLDYLPAALPPEAFYALQALRAFGVSSGFAQGLWNVGQFDAGKDSWTPENAVQVAGWATAMREIAVVHLRVLKACLAGASARTLAFQSDRHSTNLQRIFCLWWRLHHFTDAPRRLSGLVEEFHSGRRAFGVSAFCSFYQFVEQIQRQNQTGAFSTN
jgi:hypothetical protein